MEALQTCRLKKVSTIKNDEQIAKGIINKDKSAFNALVDAYGGLIKSIVRHHLSSFLCYQDECVNDILLSVWQNMERYDSNKNTLKNWIGAISKYKCIDYKRKYYKENCIQALDINMADNRNEYDSILNDEVESLLKSLKPRDRELFYRHYILGEKVELIAEQTESKPSNLYNRLTRGRKKLRAILQRSEFNEE